MTQTLAVWTELILGLRNCDRNALTVASTALLNQTALDDLASAQASARRLLCLCISWINSHPVPPNWSRCDWQGELIATASEALCETGGHNRPLPPNRTCENSACRLALARVQRRYRQECRFGTRFVTITELSHQHPPETENHRRRQASTEPAADASKRFEAVRECLTLLPAPGRRLLEGLFLEGKTESELAAELGLSRQAVHKRKRVTLALVRASLKEV
jgi:hypothetical protein